MVVLVSRSGDALEEVKKEIEAGGHTAEVRVCDVGDGKALNALIEDVASTYGRLDILVNNAGITRDGLILRMSDEDFDTVVNINLRSIFVACRAAARPMMKGRFGRIINIGSVTGLVGNPGQVNYAASKAALGGISKSIAKELGSKGVTSNVVAPGFIETEMTEGLGSQILEGIKKTIPLRRLGKPEEIASVVSFLASEDSSYISGQILVVDGGLIC